MKDTEADEKRDIRGKPNVLLTCLDADMQESHVYGVLIYLLRFCSSTLTAMVSIITPRHINLLMAFLRYYSLRYEVVTDSGVYIIILTISVRMSISKST